MEILIREYQDNDLPQMMDIWNGIVDKGVDFPQDQPLNLAEAKGFFARQSLTAVAETEGEIIGLYILHPNNVGRCAHIANASYAVKPCFRGMHIGEKLVRHSLVKAKELGFNILQFNAVVKTNAPAILLYKKLGFVKLGTIPEGFRQKKDNQYEDILLFYRQL